MSINFFESVLLTNATLLEILTSQLHNYSSYSNFSLTSQIFLYQSKTKDNGDIIHITDSDCTCTTTITFNHHVVSCAAISVDVPLSLFKLPVVIGLHIVDPGSLLIAMKFGQLLASVLSKGTASELVV